MMAGDQTLPRPLRIDLRPPTRWAPYESHHSACSYLYIFAFIGCFSIIWRHWQNGLMKSQAFTELRRFPFLLRSLHPSISAPLIPVQPRINFAKGRNSLITIFFVISCWMDATVWHFTQERPATLTSCCITPYSWILHFRCWYISSGLHGLVIQHPLGNFWQMNSGATQDTYTVKADLSCIFRYIYLNGVCFIPNSWVSSPRTVMLAKVIWNSLE